METAVLLIVGAVIGAVIDRALTLFSTRPKLSVAGSGGGGSANGAHVSYLTVSNLPGVFGVRFQESTILGRPIHGFVQKGLPVERNPARECIGRLHDRRTGDFVAQLWWWTPREHPTFRPIREIAIGDRAQLMLFSTHPDGSPRYVPFTPADQSSPDPIVLAPSEHAWLGETHEFEIRVTYSYGAQVLKHRVTVKREMAGTIRVVT